MSYALTGLPATAIGSASPGKSLTLIQGAFSHFAFARPTPSKAVAGGALSRVVNRVDGPLLSTFSAADQAVGWWYPAANKTALKSQGSAYGFAAGGIYQLDANKVIAQNQSPFAGAHCDICHPEVAWAVVSAARL